MITILKAAHCRARRRIPLAATGVVAAAAIAAAATLTEDFSGMRTGVCYPDGTVVNGWQFVYNGYGCNAFASVAGNTMLVERPLTATVPGETHASLVLGPSALGDLSLGVSSVTTRQLRVNAAPNPWEVAWVVWHYADPVHFYYFIAKPNGWELGKADPAYAGAQRFLATGGSPTFPIGAWYRLEIAQTGSTIQASVDGRVVASVTDTERPYSAGRVGLYTEDAEVYFDDVALTTGAPKGRGKKPR
jgi:hypothetical protein